MGAQDFGLPVWLVAIAATVMFALRGVLYFRDLTSDGSAVPGSADEAADRKEILILVRQSHRLQERHIEELGLLRQILQEHHKASSGAIDKISEVHDAVTKGG